MEKATSTLEQKLDAVVSDYSRNSPPRRGELTVLIRRYAAERALPLVESLREAIEECEEHNEEYHHRTRDQVINHWKELVRQADSGLQSARSDEAEWR
jgi:hypothetical protein